ncbi:MFS transporter, partial [Candidatus Aerophobetes bacterium]|nr:MFS transporter [Candidatus Aerophobetes bacterium]
FTSLGFAFARSFIAFVILFALYGIVYALVDGNQRAYVSDLSPAKLRATALGTFHTTSGLIALPASLIAGFLYQKVTSTVPFIYGSLISVISVVLFIIFITKRKA